MSDSGSEDSRSEDRRAEGPSPSQGAFHPFAAGQVPEREQNGEGPAEPDGYGADRLEAIVRSPSSLLLYWDLSGPEGARVRQGAREGEGWVLRLTDVGSGRRTETPVETGSRNYYMRVEPGRAYVAELGAGAGKAFRPACRTKEVQMPPGGGPAAFEQHGPRAGAFEQKGPSGPAGAETLPGLTFEPSLLHGGYSSGAPARRE
ncbi:MAG: DUF4912 domain-containing protein [Candidatus Brocadiia bacterium]|nr:DUF4912 domain-containing protein [Candidatus Brocadiia bacterium]